MRAQPIAGTSGGRGNASETFFFATCGLSVYRRKAGCPISRAFSAREAGKLPLVLPFFEHVLDRRLVNHQIRLAVFTVHLDAIPVVPFDDAVYFLAIAQNDHHWRPRLHLLLVIKILGVGLLRRRGFLPCAACPRHTIAAIAPPVHTFYPVMTIHSFAPFRSLHGSGVVVIVVLYPRQSWPNQLAIGEVFLLRDSGWDGIHNFFHCGRPLARSFTQTTTPWDRRIVLLQA